MRIYNPTKIQISIPLTEADKINVPPIGTSISFMPNPKFLSLLVTSFDYSELALIVSGPIEMAMCSETPCASGFVVSSLEEAIERFAVNDGTNMKNSAKLEDPNNKEEETTVKTEDKTEEKKEEETSEIVNEETTATEEVVAETKTTTTRKSRKKKN